MKIYKNALAYLNNHTVAWRSDLENICCFLGYLSAAGTLFLFLILVVILLGAIDPWSATIKLLIAIGVFQGLSAALFSAAYHINWSNSHLNRGTSK